MLEKVKNLQDDLLNKNSTMMLTFALTDMFYVALMFLVFVMPNGYVAVLTSVAGGVIASIIMSHITTVPGVEGQEALAGKLCFFPVNKDTIRKAQYFMAFKITGIQLLLTMIPIVVTFFQFDLMRTLTALGCTAGSMLLISVFMIEMNLISYKRK